MKKFLLTLMILLFNNSVGIAEERYRMGIDGKMHKVHSAKEIDDIVKEIDQRLTQKPIQPITIKLTERRWVEDVITPGLWYYGYYVSVNNTIEFRFSRREYKGALSNFNSLTSVYHKYDMKINNVRRIPVVYEYPY